VNELKKSTLASYAKKAANSMDTHAYHAYRHQDDSDYDKKEKRKQGIGKAVDRLAKEQGVAEGEVEENKKGVRAVKHTVKPRNFVAKNAVQSGAGAHKDKKKAQKQGDVKHKSKETTYESKLQTALDRKIIR
jgi:hypothetical protein